jgi:hypothetical protein
MAFMLAAFNVPDPLRGLFLVQRAAVLDSVDLCLGGALGALRLLAGTIEIDDLGHDGNPQVGAGR